MLFDLRRGRELASGGVVSVNGDKEEAGDPFVRQALRLNAAKAALPQRRVSAELSRQLLLVEMNVERTPFWC